MAKTLEELALLEPLWDKAIQSPSSVTLDEKHQILEWPTMAIMQANAQKHLNLSVDDLFHKAATNPDSLTYPECLLMDNDFRIMKLLDQAKYSNDRLRWEAERPDLIEKRNQARAIVLSPVEAEAFANLRDDNIFFPKQMAYYAALQAKRKPLTMPRGWIKNVLDQEGEVKTFGFVFYHPKDQEKNLWEKFREKFDEILKEPMFSADGFDLIEEFKVAEFVEFESPNPDNLDILREKFRNLRARNDLKPGVLSNVFLLASNEACESYMMGRQKSYLWAVDPDWLQTGVDEDGYDGRVKISATQIFYRFYEFMSTREFTLKEIWHDFHQVNETQTLLPGPLVAWQLTNLDKSARVWPTS